MSHRQSYNNIQTVLQQARSETQFHIPSNYPEERSQITRELKNEKTFVPSPYQHS